MKKNIVLFLLSISFTICISQTNNTQSLTAQQDSTHQDNNYILAQEKEFMEKYEIGNMKGIRSKMLDEFEMRSGPSCTAENTGITIPKDSIVFAYKYFNEERCWAVKYNTNWGFVKDELVFPVFENTNEKQANKYDEPPQPKGQIKPKYPPEAKKKGISGKVYVKIYIDETGVATDAIILRGIDELNQAAIDAVKAVKYKPAKLEGKEVGVWVNLSITFSN
ncbi:MAG: energy transducer TonB [Bacteroidales bacterium]